MHNCRQDALTYNVSLSLTVEESSLGNEAIETAKLYAGQISAMKRRAEEQAAEAARIAAAEKELAKDKGKEKAKDTDDPMDGEGTGGGDADGEGEEEGDELEELPAQPRKGRSKAHVSFFSFWRRFPLLITFFRQRHHA
jgi:hypothetical protein